MPPHQWYHGFRIPAEWERKPLPLISRNDWGAEPPKEDIPTTKTRIKSVIFAFNTQMQTCINQEQCTMAVQELQKRHMKQGYSDIFYNFVLGGDGKVYEGRGWYGKHPGIYHPTCGRCLVVGIIGHGKDGEKNWFPPFDWTTKILVNYGRTKGHIIKEPKTHEDRFEIVDSDKNGTRYFPYDKDAWLYNIHIDLGDDIERHLSKWEMTSVRLVREGVYDKYILEEKLVYHWFDEIPDFVDGVEPNYTLVPFKPKFNIKHKRR